MNPDEIIETVTVVRDGVEYRINKSDFNPDKDKLAGTAAAPATSGGGGSATPQAQAPVSTEGAGGDGSQTGTSEGDGIVPPPAGQPAPGSRVVMKKGKKFLVVDTAGQPINDANINPAGYDAEADAWKAAYGVVTA